MDSEQAFSMDSADQTPEGAVDAVPVPEEPRGQWSGVARAASLLAGVVFPVVCFVLAKDFSPDWQSGAVSDYAMLLLSWRPASAFYPVLFYSMASMTLLVFAFDRGAKVFIVRLGIYTGVVLSGQYLAIAALAAPGLAIVGTIVALMLWGFQWSYSCMVSEVSYVSPGKEPPVLRPGPIMVFFFVPSVVMGGVFLLTVPCLASVLPGCGPPWAILAYSAMAYRLMRERRSGRWQFSLAQLLGAMTWFGAWLGAWRISVGLMLDKYADLPISAPGCYVATAAARGHRRWVRSENVVGPAGEVRRINDQLRYLKAFELVWARVAPRSHRACRRCYDRFGPVTAAILVHPLLADLAYAALKPAEWTARAALAVLVPGGGKLARRLYRRW
jgi:hypothetical protein